MTTTTTLGELTGDHVLDSARTRIGFVARAAMISKVRGRFDDFEGTAHLDGDDPSRSGVRIVIRAGSISTGKQKRDDHLRSADFLDVGRHPTITFTSTKVRQVGETRFEVTGDLTVHGVTGPATVHFELTGAGNDPHGGPRAAFRGRAIINRKDWGVSWGGLLISEKVALELDVAATRRR
ncbi:YceI family protein [Streptomyces sp. NPDC056479]|uniref:YceI family protein n=1 Tax=Streptomyces sp. NPDC056479 TaxID=3345832 RepID=UPI0036A183E6